MERATGPWYWSTSGQGFSLEVTCAAEGFFPVSVVVDYRRAPGLRRELAISREKQRVEFKFEPRPPVYLRGSLWCEPLEHSRMALLGQLEYQLESGGPHRFEGTLLELPCRAGVEPVRPTRPAEPAQSSDPCGLDAELFPYLYLRPRPLLEEAIHSIAFVRYDGPLEPPAESFPAQLAQIKKQGGDQARAAMEQRAADFIAGQILPGSFIPRVRGLKPPACRLPLVARRVQEAPPADLADLRAQVLATLDIEIAPLREYLASAAWAELRERAWASLFALLCAGREAGGERDQISALLIGAHLACFAVDCQAEEPALLQLVLAAALLLPQAIFPLPAPPAAAAAAGVLIYGVGDLHMVRRRLLRYRLGEVAAVETLLPGERREVSRRRLHSLATGEEGAELSGEARTGDTGAGGDTLGEAVQRTLAEQSLTADYNKLTIDYGAPPERVIGGSVTRTLVAGGRPGQEARTRFARQVLERSVSRMERQLGRRFATRQLEEVEESAVSSVENRREQAATVVYRWLEKVYEARVVNYGARLLLELQVAEPAAAYIRAEAALRGLDLVRPPTLAEQGVHSFRDITAGNYATLAAAYGAPELAPPPEPVRSVGLGLRAGEERLLPLPPGYLAQQATVACGPAGGTLEVLVADRPLVCGGGAVTLPEGLADQVAVAVALPPQSTAKPPAAPAGDLTAAAEEGAQSAPAAAPRESATTAAAPVVLNLTCVPGPRLWDEWCIDTWRRLYAARQAAERAYLAAAAEAGSYGGPPLARRRTELAILRRGCLQTLLGRRLSPGGEEMRCLALLDRALEWPELSYELYAGEGGSPVPALDPAEAPFTALLQAGMARVLVPARPGEGPALLYYLACGECWSGEPRYAPVHEQDAQLALLLAESHPGPGQPVEAPWELVVPTAMRVVDRGGLPGLPGE